MTETPEQRLQQFIERGKHNFDVLKSRAAKQSVTLEWNEGRWPMRWATSRRTGEANIDFLFSVNEGRISQENVFQPLPDWAADFVRATIVSLYFEQSITAPRNLDAYLLELRRVIKVANDMGVTSPIQLLPLHFQEAHNRKPYSEGGKRRHYQRGHRLETLSTILNAVRFTPMPLKYANPAPVAHSEKKDKRPSVDIQDYLAEAVNSPINDDERILMECIRLHFAKGNRAGESVTLPVDCLIKIPREGKPGEFDYGIRYYPEKGFENGPLIKPLDKLSGELAEMAITALQELCQPARDRAAVLEQDMERVPIPGFDDLVDPSEFISDEQLNEWLGYSSVENCVRKLRQYGIDWVKREHANDVPVLRPRMHINYYRYGDVIDKLTGKPSGEKIPHLDDPETLISDEQLFEWIQPKLSTKTKVMAAFVKNLKCVHGLEWIKREKVEKTYTPRGRIYIHYYRVRDIEEWLLKRRAELFPLRHPDTGEPILKLSECLMVRFENQFSFARELAPMKLLVRLVSKQDLQDALGQSSFANKGEGKGTQSIFDRRGMKMPDGSPVRVLTHSGRHLKNTFLSEAGLTSVQQALIMGRKDLRQNVYYDHADPATKQRTLRGMLEQGDLQQRGNAFKQSIRDGFIKGDLVTQYQAIKINDPVKAEEFLELNAGQVLMTRYGACSNDWSTGQRCPKFNRCFNKCTHLHATGDDEEIAELEKELEVQEIARARILQEAAEGAYGADTALDANTRDIEGIQRALAASRQVAAQRKSDARFGKIAVVQVFPDGESLFNPVQGKEA